MNPAITKLWNQANQDFGHILGQNEAKVFLTTLLLYPLHPILIGKKQYLPGIWIHGPMATGKTYLAKAGTRLFIKDEDLIPRLSNECPPASIIKLISDNFGLPIITDDFRISLPEEGEAWKESHKEEQQLTYLRHGYTGGYRPEHRLPIRMSPPIVVGQDPAFDQSTMTRFFHFTPIQGSVFNRNNDIKPVTNQDELHHIGRAIRSESIDLTEQILRIIDAPDNHIAAENDRVSYMLSLISAAHYTFNKHLGGNPDDDLELTTWLSNFGSTLFPLNLI